MTGVRLSCKPEDAQAINEQDMLPADPVTVVLSEAGWIRAAKGHEVDAGNLNFRAGDQYLSHAQGKSNQRVYVLDVMPGAAML